MFIAAPAVNLGVRPDSNGAIYALSDPGDGLVRYVGWTRGSLESRLRSHLKNPTNAKMSGWLLAVISAGQFPVISALCFAPKGGSRWQFEERRWIAWFRERGELLNVQRGGEVTQPMLKPPDKTFPLAAGDIPSKKRNPFGARGCWDPVTDSWAAVSSVSVERLARSRLDPRFPHPPACPCRKCGE